VSYDFFFLLVSVCESIHKVGLEETNYSKEETNLKGFMECLFLNCSFSILELDITVLYFRARLFLMMVLRKARELGRNPFQFSPSSLFTLRYKKIVGASRALVE